MNNVPPDPAPLFAPFLARAEAAESEAASLRAALTAEREAHATTKRARDQAAGEADAFVKSHDDFANACRAAMECAWRVLPLHASEVPAWIVRLGSQRDDAQRRANEAEGERDAALARAEAAERERDAFRAQAEASLVVPCACGRPMPSVSSRLRCDACRAERKLDQARATLRAAANRARGIAQSAADDEAALAVLGPLVAELRALRAVRDAAEAFLSPPTLHAIGDARERLRAALDAAKAGG